MSFGADAVVQPGGFYVGYKNYARGDFGFGFGIGASETVYLLAPDGTLNAMGIFEPGLNVTGFQMAWSCTWDD